MSLEIPPVVRDIISSSQELKNIQLIKLLRINDRFASYQAAQNNQSVFIKFALSNKTQSMLERQVRCGRSINLLGKKSELIKFRAPQIFAHSNQYIVTEWIKGDSLLQESLQSNPTQIAKTTAQILYVFDKYGTKLKTPPRYNPRTSLDQTTRSLIARFENQSLGNLPKGLFEQSIACLETSLRGLVACLQDGDVKPEHVYYDSDQKEYIIIDSEHLRRTWPRCYDLGNLVAKYLVSKPNPPFAKKLIDNFMRLCKISRSDLLPQLQPTLVIRGIYLHAEHDKDSDDVQKRLAWFLETAIFRPMELL